MSKIHYKAGAPIPKSLGRCVDEYHAVKELRLAMEKETSPIKKRESELQEHLIENLSSDDTGVSGKKYRGQIVVSRKPTVEDWEKVYNYVVENDSFDIMGKSINATAVKERWDNKQKIPGIAAINVKKLSVTKL